MANKFTRTIDSTLLKNKIDMLYRTLQNALSDPSISTREQLVAIAANMITSFYKDLAGPLFQPRLIQAGDPPDPDDFNANLQAVLDDLNIIFAELENVEGIILENFNYFVSESNRLNRKTKSVASKLGDLVLFSKNVLKNSLFFTDSFNNINRIDFNSNLLNSTQCEINQSEGIITLPVIRTPDSIIKADEDPAINTNSNGTPGNNFELGQALNNDIKAVLDNNADTWFEYERVLPIDADDQVPLVLDLTINLGESKILNFVRINPNNFGTRTQVEIDTIETSIDGTSFVSIKDEIPIPGFIVEDEENIFALSPSTSKFAGQGLFTFTPRQAKYIHIVLRQRSPYIIESATGKRLRYAIGIRDINLEAQVYESRGEIISTEFSAAEEIRKILVDTSQSPSEESELASITHQISPDNGITWHDIRSAEFTGFSDVVNAVPEILNFNTNLDGDVSTADPVLRVRYRAILERFPEAFQPENSSSLRKNIGFTTELHQVPDTSPFTITLSKTPVKGTVKVIDPQLGSRGIDNYNYEFAIGNAGEQIHELPFTDVQPDLVKTLVSDTYFVEESNPEIILVNGREWSKNRISLGNPVDKIYEIDYARGTIRFGDGLSGQAATTGAIISIRLTPERALLEPTPEGRRYKLQFPTNGDKKTITIQKFDDIRSQSEPLEKSVKKFRLLQDDLIVDSESFLPSTQTIFTDKKTFLDGVLELSNTGDYSIDYETGTLYSFSRTSSTSDIAIVYNFDPIVELLETEWDFEEETVLKDTIIISDDAFSTIEVSDEAIPAGVQKFSLSKFNIERGTVRFTVPSGVSTPFGTEVDFIDGRTEILGLVEATERIDPSSTAGTGLNTFVLSLEPVGQSIAPITFSNTDAFTTLVAGVPSSDGEYRITGSTVEVFLDSPETKPGFVTYFYLDPTVDSTGLYSIDYLIGNVYTNDVVPSGITLDFEFAKFLVKYPIARAVPEEDFQVNEEDATVTLSDREILKRSQISSAVDKAVLTRDTYQILYNFVDENREDLTALEPHFSPILKEYALRVLTKGNLI